MSRRGRVEGVVRGVLGPLVADGRFVGVDLITVEACFVITYVGFVVCGGV